VREGREIPSAMRPENRRSAVLGHTGFLGSAVSRQLTQMGVSHIGTSLTAGVDMRDLSALRAWFDEHRPYAVYNCAAYVGGIQFGLKHPVGLFENNLQITLNLYRCCAEFDVLRMVNPISNCVYPSKATLFREPEVWDGPLDDSVLIYGMARKMHFVGARAYTQEYGLDVVNIVLPNMYGPGDHFDPMRSHALGGLIKKIVDAHDTDTPEVVIWGTGTPIREWLYIDDGASAMLAAMEAGSFPDLINVGTGEGESILDTAKAIQRLVGYRGSLVLDTTKRDGAPCKTLDGSRGRSMLGWEAETSFEEGLRRTIDWYIENQPTLADHE
jgi:GDP-L-fucose synthase